MIDKKGHLWNLYMIDVRKLLYLTLVLCPLNNIFLLWFYTVCALFNEFNWGRNNVSVLISVWA